MKLVDVPGSIVAIPLNAVEFTWTFALLQGTEYQDVAEFSIWCWDADYAPDEPQLLKLAVGGNNAWIDNVSDAHWGSNVGLVLCTARNFDASGHTLMEQSIKPATDWFGVASGPCLPWETSLALSLYTYPRGSFVAHGRRKRGRIYLPPMSASTLDGSNSGFYSDSSIGSLLVELANFVGRVGQDDLGVKHTRPSVFSRVDGICRPISQLSIDAKFDSQRRRENRENAGHIELAYHE